jgi:hypothetical protein
MDPISHVAFGRTLAALDRRLALGPGAVAACVIGSLAPDVDAVLMPYGWDTYLRLHQGGQEQSVARGDARRPRPARHEGARGFRRRMRPYGGRRQERSDLLLDVISGADIRFSGRRGPSVALPLFAMADPWLGGVLVLGLVTLAFSRCGIPPAACAIS